MNGRWEWVAWPNPVKFAIYALLFSVTLVGVTCAGEEIKEFGERGLTRIYMRGQIHHLEDLQAPNWPCSSTADGTFRSSACLPNGDRQALFFRCHESTLGDWWSVTDVVLDDGWNDCAKGVR